jgi:hypothetical protein
MEFMLLFTEPAGAPKPEPGRFTEMKAFAEELADQGKLRRGAPLRAASEGARVRVRDGKALVSDGPFAESKEVVGGFWIVDVASREEAIEIARRCPHARYGRIELHPVRARYSFADPEKGTPFLFAFRMEHGLTDSDNAKMNEMIAFGQELERNGKLFETAPLGQAPPAARVETRSGKILVTDGPFAEAKEAVGGYSLVRAEGREEAIEIAKRYPHAKWGPVEVREIIYFDRA